MASSSNGANGETGTKTPLLSLAEQLEQLTSSSSSDNSTWKELHVTADLIFQEKDKDDPIAKKEAQEEWLSFLQKWNNNNAANAYQQTKLETVSLVGLAPIMASDAHHRQLFQALCSLSTTATTTTSSAETAKLRHLSLQRCGLTAMLATRLYGKQQKDKPFPWQHLQTLNLRDNPKLGPRGIKAILQAADTYWKTADTQQRHMKHQASVRNLTMNIEPEEEIGDDEGLQLLDLTNVRLGHFGAQALQGTVPNTITHLYLGRNDLQADGIWKLAAADGLANLNHLQHLDLSYNQLGDDGAAQLICSLGQNSLTGVGSNSRMNKMTDNHKKACQSLRILDLRGNSIGTAGMVSLRKQLNTLTSLEELHLQHNQIGNEGAQELSLALAGASSALAELYLSHNEIGDAGALALAMGMLGKNNIGNDEETFASSLERTDSRGEDMENQSHATDPPFEEEEDGQDEEIVWDLTGGGGGDGSSALFDRFSLKDNSSTHSRMKKSMSTASQTSSNNNKPSISHLKELHLDHNDIGDEGVGAFVEHAESVPSLHVVNLQNNDKISPDRLRILDMLLKHRDASTRDDSEKEFTVETGGMLASEAEIVLSPSDEYESGGGLFPNQEVSLWGDDYGGGNGYFDFGDEVELQAEEAILVSTGRELLSLALGSQEQDTYGSAYHGDGEILELPMPYTRRLTQEWDVALAHGAFGSMHVVEGSGEDENGNKIEAMTILDEEDAAMLGQTQCKLFIKRVLMSPATGPMDGLRKGVMNEIVTHMNGHPNMASLLAMSKTDEAHQQECAFVYKTAGHCQTLHDILNNRPNRSLLSWSIRLRIARQIAHALDYLHNPSASSVRIKSFYGDLQPNNIVVSMDSYDPSSVEVTVQLLDAGLSRLIGTDRERFQKGDSVFGSRGYRCPRYERGSCNYDEKSDMFAFGIVLAELWTSKLQKSTPLQPVVPTPTLPPGNSQQQQSANNNSTPSPNKKKKNRNKKKGRGGAANNNNNQNNGKNNNNPPVVANTLAYDVYYDHLLAHRPLAPDPLAGPLMRPELPQVYGKLIQYCTNIQPSLRPTAEQVGNALDNLLRFAG